LTSLAQAFDLEDFNHNFRSSVKSNLEANEGKVCFAESPQPAMEGHESKQAKQAFDDEIEIG